MFLTDLLLNCITGYRTPDDVLVMSPKLIFKHYLRVCHGVIFTSGIGCTDGRHTIPQRLFWIDLISSFPFDWIAFIAEGDYYAYLRASRGLKLLRLARLLRLLRLPRLFRYSGRFMERFNSAHVRVLKLIFLLLLFSHWNGRRHAIVLFSLVS